MRVILHGEWSDEQEFGWWGESPDHPEFSAAADDLAELRSLVKEAAELHGWSVPQFEFAQTGPPSGNATPTRRDDGPAPTVVEFAAA